MSAEERLDPRVGGVKAKHMLNVRDSHHEGVKADEPVVPVLLIISPWHQRISILLQDILQKSGKHLECVGEELYRKSLSRLNADLSHRVVGLVVTDKPDDCYAPSRSEYPLWKEALVNFQQDYLESWKKEIEDEVFPGKLTVISYFRTKKGKLSEEEIERIEEEFAALPSESSIELYSCLSEDEIQKMVDQTVVGMVLERQQQRVKIKKLTRTRTQKIARAKKVTKDAVKRL